MQFQGLYDELRDVVAAQWPEVVGSNGGRKIWDAEHVLAVPFEEIAAQYGLPYAVIAVPEVTAIPLGLANRSYALLTEVYLVRATDAGAGSHWPLLETLCAYLRANGLAWGRVWDDPDPEPDWSYDLPVNETLRSKKLPMLAGLASFVVVLSESDA